MTDTYTLDELKKIETTATRSVCENIDQLAASFAQFLRFTQDRDLLDVRLVDYRELRRYDFGMRLRQLLAKRGVANPESFPLGMTIEANLSVQTRNRRTEQIELIWWFVAPINSIAMAGTDYGPATILDLERERWGIAHYDLEMPAIGRRLVVFAAPSWENSMSETHVHQYLTALSKRSVIGFGLATVAAFEHKALRYATSQPGITAIQFCMELLNPRTNYEIQEWLVMQKLDLSKPVSLDAELARELSVAPWRLHGAAAALVAKDPSLYQIVKPKETPILFKKNQGI